MLSGAVKRMLKRCTMHACSQEVPRGCACMQGYRTGSVDSGEWTGLLDRGQWTTRQDCRADFYTGFYKVSNDLRGATRSMQEGGSLPSLSPSISSNPAFHAQEALHGVGEVAGRDGADEARGRNHQL